MSEESSISRMCLYSRFDDMEELRANIDKKAEDLFEAKPAKPQLQVTRTFKASMGQEKGVVCVLRHQDVGHVSQVKALQRVREHQHLISVSILIY